MEKERKEYRLICDSTKKTREGVFQNRSVIVQYTVSKSSTGLNQRPESSFITPHIVLHRDGAKGAIDIKSEYVIVRT